MKILVVDDDATFRERLAFSLQKRGHEVRDDDGTHVLQAAREFQPEAALLDLKMPEGNGLFLIPRLRELLPDLRMVILTGYGSIATAMEAVRLGAADYLTKPVDAGQIEAALSGRKPVPPDISIPSLDRVEWEHLQRILADCGNNISQAARLLGIDRRSLQRKLAKYPPDR